MLNLESSAQADHSGLDELVEVLPGYGWAATAGGEIISLNRSFRARMGVPLQSHEKRYVWSDAVGGRDGELLRSEWADGVLEGEAFNFTCRMSTSDGLRWMKAAARPHPSAVFGQDVWIGTFLDVDEMMTAMERSRRNGSWMKALIDTVPAPIWSADPNGEPTYINRALALQTGINIDDLEDGSPSVLAAAIANAIHPDDMEKVGTALGRSFATGEPFLLKYRQRRADGSFGWIRGEAEALRNADGAIVQWYGVCYDIDNEVKAQESLRSAHEALTKASQFAAMAELSASIGHDVSQPLSSTVASADACLSWLTKDPPNYQRALRSAQNAFRDANAASEILTRIRALFQRTPPQRKAEDLNRIVPQAFELLASEMARSGVKAAQALSPGLPLVRVDAVQIQQVLVNLIRNAAEAMVENVDTDKLVVVRTKVQGAELVVEVEDTGPGVHDTEGIFEPYVTTKSKGMGMGLSISRSMIGSHGGRLWAENREGGARFSFALGLDGGSQPDT